MGWKNVRDHYGIKHIVCIAEKGLCIGSPYVHDLIVIVDADKPRDWHDTIDRRCTSIGHNLQIWRSVYLGQGEPFDGIVKAMAADPAKLRELIETPDTFERSITVWTCDYFKGLIIEKQCEEVGWPNVTHDGELMYENSFSTDRAEIVEYARRNAAAGLESAERNIADAEQKLAERREIRDKYAAALAKFEKESA